MNFLRFSWEFLPPGPASTAQSAGQCKMRSFLLPRNTDKTNQWSLPKWATRCWRCWWCLPLESRSGFAGANLKVDVDRRWNFQNMQFEKNMIHSMHNMSKSRNVMKMMGSEFPSHVHQTVHKVPGTVLILIFSCPKPGGFHRRLFPHGYYSKKSWIPGYFSGKVGDTVDGSNLAPLGMHETL